MKIKDEVLDLGFFYIKDGGKIRFWGDTWFGNVSFKVQYPSLYNIVCDLHETIDKVMATIPLNLSFKRALVDNKLIEWHNLVAQPPMLNWWTSPILLDGT
jgi:hypothetical protein